MLIVDVRLSSGGTERVGVVGSCRLLAPMQAAMRAKLCRSFKHICRSYAYTASEARQHFAICRGELAVPHSIARYVLGELNPTPFSSDWADAVESCDTFLVEISSLEDFLNEQFIFNILGIFFHLVKNTGPEMLKWCRELSSKPSGLAAIATVEESLKSRGVEVIPAIHDIICSLRKSVMDEGSFGEALQAVVFDLAKRWIFVPVFDVSEDPTFSIPARAALRNVLQRETAAHGYEFFDPTPIIAKAGRLAALDGEGVQPIHYARSFEPIIGEALCRCIAQGGRRPLVAD